MAFENPFRIRIGINTGYCNVGNFGSNQRLTYTIIGGEVNVAQRLESNADVGGILISNETYHHAKNIVEVEQKDSFRMKGIDREIKAYKITSRKKNIKKNLESERNIDKILKKLRRLNLGALNHSERKIIIDEINYLSRKKN